MNDQVVPELSVEIGDAVRIFGFLTTAEGGAIDAVAVNGDKQALTLGDPILEGSTLRAEPEGQFLIVLQDGTIRELPSGGSLQVTREAMTSLKIVDHDSLAFDQFLAAMHQDALLTEMLAFVANGGSVADFLSRHPALLAELSPEAEMLLNQTGLEPDSPEFQELLAALQAGEDISKLLEKTGAGDNGNVALSDSIQQAALIDRELLEVNPEAGIEPDLDLPAPPLPTADSGLTGAPPSVLLQASAAGSVTGDNIAENQDILLTATVSQPPQGSELILTLSNGLVIVIPEGATTGSVVAPAQGDDVYLDGETINISIVDTEGGDYDVLNTSTTATATIVDTIDNTILTLTNLSVNEGSGTATIGATLSNPAGTAFTVTLDNGATLSFAQGDLEATSTPFAIRDDNPYIDGDSYPISVSDTGNHNFELLTTVDGTLTVNDAPTLTTLTLTNVSIEEGSGAATIGATLSNPAGTAFTVTLDNGATLSFAEGDLEATSSPFAIQGDDPYVDGDSYPVSVSDTGEHNFEVLNTIDGTVTVSDTPTETTLSLVSFSVDEGSGTATIGTTLSNPAGTAFTVTLDNGATISFAQGDLEATSTPFAIQGDDPYIDGENYPVSVSDTGNHNFEMLTTVDGTVTVTDTPDVTTLTLANINVEAGSDTATIGATLSNPAGTAFTVTLDNGATLSFAEGDLEATSTPFAVQGDDPYIDGDNSYPVGVSDAGKHNFEVLNTIDGTVTVSDMLTETTLTLVSFSVDEGSGTATIGATLSNPAGTAFTVTLDNGATLSFAQGDLEAISTPFAIQGDDPYVDGESYPVSVSDTGSHNFEMLTTVDGTVTVTDTPDVTTLTLANINVEAGSDTATIGATLSNPAGTAFTVTLDNGATLSFAEGDLEAISTPFAVQGDDPYIDGDNSYPVGVSDAGEHNFEVFNTIDGTVTVSDMLTETTLTLVTFSVDEGSGTATIGATLSNPAGTAFTVTLDNGATISFAQGDLEATSTPFAIQGDDPYVDGESYPVSVSDAGNHNFELLTTVDGIVTVNDTLDTTGITLEDVSVDEGAATASISATVLSGPRNTPLLLTLDNGATITFGIGETSAVSTSFAVGAEGQTAVAIVSASGGNYEALDITDTATVTVTNLPPLSANQTIIVDEDQPYQFDGSEFAFNDTPGDALASVTITSLPINGSLYLYGEPVSTGQVISAADITGLSFVPPADASGNDYSMFSFSVSDGTDSSSEQTITVDLDPVADMPVIAASTVSTNGYAYSVTTFKTETSSSLTRIDLDTGSQDVIGPVRFAGKTIVDIEALAGDPLDDNILYGFVNNGGSRALIKIDIEKVAAGDADAVTQYTAFNDTSSLMGSTFANGTLYVFTQDGGNSKLYSIDTGTDTFAEVGNISGQSITAMTFDVSTQTFYAVNTDGDILIIDGIEDGGVLTASQIVDGAGEPLTVSGSVESLAYSQNGKIFAIDRVSGQVFEIDPENMNIANVLTLDVSDFKGDGIEALAITTSGSTVIHGGDQFGITLSAQFGDTQDNSEDHYFLVKVPDASWLAGGTSATIISEPAGVPSGTYAKIEVDGFLDEGGNAIASLILKSPETVTESLDIQGFSVYAVAEEMSDAGLDSSDDLAVTEASVVEVQILNGDSIYRGTDHGDDISGTGDADLIYGGGGDDLLTGDAGADIFVWLSGDENLVLPPAIDTITDFSIQEGDVLNLSDLLQGEENAASLESYLSFSSDSIDTTISIDVGGDGGAAEQLIVLQNVDLVTGNSQADIIHDLVLGGNLVTDTV